MGKAPSGSFPESVYASAACQPNPSPAYVYGRRTGVADSCVVDLDSDFVCFWGRDFNVFDCQIFAGFPCNRSLPDVNIDF
jgi:hypothetical protein